MMASSNLSSVYILSAKYASSSNKPQERVFAEAGLGKRSLEEWLLQAGERVREEVSDIPGLWESIALLRCATMPVTSQTTGRQSLLPISNQYMVDTLSHTLQLPSHCSSRLEWGTSAAGAFVFASTVQALRGVGSPASALVFAGQVMPGGVQAIETVGQVLDADEHHAGLRMIPVGDALLDAQWSLLQEEMAAHEAPPNSPKTPQSLLHHWVEEKLQKADSYPPAQRNSTTPRPNALPMARWMERWHMAAASDGACAALLTTDPELVKAWQRQFPERRPVQVVGLGEFTDAPAVLQREQPLLYARSMRQALARCCDVLSHPEPGLQCEGYFFHDAFPSIEWAFLQALGWGAGSALPIAQSSQTNPFGGLITFGHALAASGLVQIVQAWEQLSTSTLPSSKALTTSVGGPVTRVAATLLEVGKPPKTLPSQASLSTTALLQLKEEWLSSCLRHIGTLWEKHSVGQLEARTRFDLRSIREPLPEKFVQQWTPAAQHPLTQKLSWDWTQTSLAEVRTALLANDFSALSEAVQTLATEVQSFAAQIRQETISLREAKRAVWTDFRVDVGLFQWGRAKQPRLLALLCDAKIPVGSLARLPWNDGSPLAYVEALQPPMPALPWLPMGGLEDNGIIVPMEKRWLDWAENWSKKNSPSQEEWKECFQMLKAFLEECWHREGLRWSLEWRRWFQKLVYGSTLESSLWKEFPHLMLLEEVVEKKK